jgi:hypothetical protein
VGHVALSFEPNVVTLGINQILPTRQLTPEQRRFPTYRRIAASIREIGLIEPLVVFPQGKSGGVEAQQYVLLDGHVRYDVLREMGNAEALCLVSTDDEGFTYNQKVSNVPPIQQHFMILKAIEHGVSEERIAASLHVNVSAIRKKRDLLDGICPEAVDLLKDRGVLIATLRELKKVVPLRQIEMAELMVAANNFNGNYARCLLAATPGDQLLDSGKPTDGAGLRPEDRSRIEREVDSVGREFRTLEDSHGRTTLHLVLAVAYIQKLLDNAAIVRRLSSNHGEILAEFQKLVGSPDLKS